MELLWFAVFFFLFLVPLVLGYVVPIYMNHNKATGSVINHDSYMRKFVYKVSLTSDEIFKILSIKNDIDELACDFDFENSIVNISEYGSHKKYYFQIQECGSFSILKLEQVSPFGNLVSFKLNPYLVSKLQAELIPFAEYSF